MQMILADSKNVETTDFCTAKKKKNHPKHYTLLLGIMLTRLHPISKIMSAFLIASDWLV